LPGFPIFVFVKAFFVTISDAYNQWAARYDSDENKTRDLEAQALRSVLPTGGFENCLEVGCGTGKNTQWLIGKSQSVTAVDFSVEMLRQAMTKVTSGNVRFAEQDITQTWPFPGNEYDLITFSLILEHIRNLDHVFNQAAQCLRAGGWIYIGELHPLRQYKGSQARFVVNGREQLVDAYVHHISEFVESARKYNIRLIDIKEYFDTDSANGLPRILVLLLQKQ
jgi:ubiquinone/menaquinone biosynthesis C-methylase UbiE